ncbi:hypothetical protein GE061_018218 [Apolygus lucorum]|uniref:Uncharacterized protein n=1 Tax=Apolygus lucorum TaxID=248454 RepID=A0A8S9XF98_APOLU|nr:hypothetical protein GE061_018218 [Apolygus lucorum]
MRALATRPPPESRHLPDGAPLPHSLRDFGCAESESLPRLGPPIQPLSTSWFQRLRLPSTASDFFNTQDCKTTTAPTLHGLLQLTGCSNVERLASHDKGCGEEIGRGGES